MRAAIALSISLLAAPAFAACPSDEAMDALASDILDKTPARLSEAPGTMEDALCAQDKLVERLTPEWGEPVGYKVGLTSQPAQERFGADGPVRGRLLRTMLRNNNATIPADFAARPLIEADMLVTVRSIGINTATTPAEVLKHIESVQPFIELADLVLAEGEPLDPEIITAINVGARMGVRGRKVPVEATPEFETALADMTVRLMVGPADGEPSEEMLAVPGRAVLGHPLEAVLWLMNDGVKLDAGDVVSLGSFGAPMPAQRGQVVRVVYEGLPNDPDVSVTLE